MNSAKVAVVNQTFAKKFGLGSDAVGKLMGSGDGYRSKLDMTIVGVVEDAKYYLLREDFRATAYYPAAQMMPVTPFPVDWTVEIRTALRAAAKASSQSVPHEAAWRTQKLSRSTGAGSDLGRADHENG